MRKAAWKYGISLIALAFFSLFAVLSSNSVLYASTFSRNIDVTVELRNANEVRVTQVHRLSWDNSSVYFPASKNFVYAYIFPAFATQTSGILNEVKDLSVKSPRAANSVLQYSTSTSDGAVQIKIPYYENLSSSNNLEFVVSYTTSLYALTEGGITEVSYPGLSADFKSRVTQKEGNYDEVTTYVLQVIIPSNLGELASIFPIPSSQTSKSGKTMIVYNSSALVEKSVRIVLGKERTVRFLLSGNTYTTNLDTPDFVKDLLVNYVDVALPTQQSGTEFANQAIYYSKIEPFPSKLWTDADGNLMARLPVSATKEGKILIEGYAVIRKGEALQASDEVKITEVPSTMAQYLKSEPQFWQVSDPQIQQAADAIADDQELASVRKTLSYVAEKLSYPESVTLGTLRRQGAVGALQSKSGVCMEYADLTLSVLRAKGIPSRAVFGDSIGARVDRTLQGIGHQWVGFWMPERGWVSADPTWSDDGPEYIGGDFDHLVWYVASVSVNEPSGFNCQSQDNASPCREALSIETVPVDTLPPMDDLLTLAQLQEKVGAENAEDAGVFAQTAQKVVSYLGGSRFGRILLSKQGVLVLFAVLLYVLLVGVVAVISKGLKKLKN